MGRPEGRMILLDTHVLIWLVSGERAIGPRGTACVRDALGQEGLAISAFSMWEIAMLARKNRLELGDRPAAFWGRVLDQGVRQVPVTGRIGISAGPLTPFHNTPPDPIIAATALAHDAPLITADGRLLHWRATRMYH